MSRAAGSITYQWVVRIFIGASDNQIRVRRLEICVRAIVKFGRMEYNAILTPEALAEVHVPTYLDTIQVLLAVKSSQISRKL